MEKILNRSKKLFLRNYKTPLAFFTFIFIAFFTFFTLFQIFYFKYYLETTLKGKVDSTLNQVETKLSDYIKFLENFYKIPFMSEFAELPESKGWLLELVNSLEELFKREKLISLAIFYNNEPFLTWNYRKELHTSKICDSNYIKKGSILIATKTTSLENKNYCIYFSLDVSYYQKTFRNYTLMVLFLYLLTLVMVLYLFYRFNEAEERKREVEKSLQAEKELALLGRMAATLAHELRNSLNNLSLLLQTQDQSTVSKEKLLEELKGLLEWTQEILLFHKDIKIEPYFFNPEMLLYELKFMAANSGKKVAELKVENQVKTLWGDPFWIKKALENLIKNSLQVIDENGIIKIHLREENGSYVAEIYDNGKPISEELKKNIFEPFFTTKKEGFGLGLYLVKKIIEAHNGKVEIENLPECGKIFRLKWKPL
ncbi:MAG: sensor histidine kinase [Caldimicrobium sp.]